MHVRRIVLLGLLIFPTLCQAQLGFHLKPGQRRVQFPIEVVNNLVIVPVVINGQLPLKFILDTGVRTTILTEKAFSDILNLTYSRRFTVAGPGGEKIVEAYVTNNVVLDMPGIHGQGHAMLVLEEDYLELRNYLGTDVQGILGYEVFSRFVVEIDYENLRLTISDPTEYKPKRRFEEFDISVEDTKPYVQVPITLQSGKTLNAKLLVDTGASHGLMLDPLSDSQITIPDKHISSLIGRGLAGEINGQIGRVRSIELGKYTLEKVITNFPDPGDYGFIDSTSVKDIFRNGAIGGELLRRFKVIFNFPLGKMYLKKNTSFGRPFNYNMSGLTLKAKGVRLRNFEVADVRKGSSGELAGIRVGDQLLSIDGIPTAEFNLNLLNTALDIREGKRLRVELLRDGKVVKTKLVLMNQI